MAPQQSTAVKIPCRPSPGPALAAQGLLLDSRDADLLHLRQKPVFFTGLQGVPWTPGDTTWGYKS
jgi:hypothetical protein